MSSKLMKSKMAANNKSYGPKVITKSSMPKSAIKKATTKPSVVKPAIKKSSVDKINSTTMPHANTDNQCLSIRSKSEPHLQCLMMTKNGAKYCPMHSIQKSITEFSFVSEDIMNFDEKIGAQSIVSTVVHNDIIKKISLDVVTNKNTQRPVTRIVKKSDTMVEQKVSTIENSYKENEEELAIKLLILVNDDEYCDKISELIGPVFHDITLSEDDQDPVTYDLIWELKNGVRVPASVNKYYLFSYQDSTGKIRCLTIFTLYNMIQDNNFIHPTTMEEISVKDITRAKELIDLFQTKIGLFKDCEDNSSPEFKLRNRIIKLFKQFHIHSIFLEENWLMNLNDTTKLWKIITETEKLYSTNTNIINPALKQFPKLFQKKQNTNCKVNSKGKGYSKAYKKDTSNEIFDLQEYIVGEWEELIKIAANAQNQFPIWILAAGLSFGIPEVKQKYPDMDLMLQ